MKDAVQLVAIAEEFADRNDPVWADVLRLVRAASRKSHRLENVMLDALEMLQDIRYRTWPSSGEPFGLNAERLDVLINEIDRALNASHRKSRR